MIVVSYDQVTEHVSAQFLRGGMRGKRRASRKNGSKEEKRGERKRWLAKGNLGCDSGEKEVWERDFESKYLHKLSNALLFETALIGGTSFSNSVSNSSANTSHHIASQEDVLNVS
jgi:hypothetical protein